MSHVTHTSKKISNESVSKAIFRAAQEWTYRTLAVHERTSVHFLVLPGSLLSVTEITEDSQI